MLGGGGWVGVGWGVGRLAGAAAGQEIAKADNQLEQQEHKQVQIRPTHNKNPNKTPRNPQPKPTPNSTAAPPETAQNPIGSEYPLPRAHRPQELIPYQRGVLSWPERVFRVFL